MAVVVDTHEADASGDCVARNTDVGIVAVLAAEDFGTGESGDRVARGKAEAMAVGALDINGIFHRGHQTDGDDVGGSREIGEVAIAVLAFETTEVESIDSGDGQVLDVIVEAQLGMPVALETIPQGDIDRRFPLGDEGYGGPSGEKQCRRDELEGFESMYVMAWALTMPSFAESGAVEGEAWEAGAR